MWCVYDTGDEKITLSWLVSPGRQQRARRLVLPRPRRIGRTDAGGAQTADRSTETSRHHQSDAGVNLLYDAVYACLSLRCVPLFCASAASGSFLYDLRCGAVQYILHCLCHMLHLFQYLTYQSAVSLYCVLVHSVSVCPLLFCCSVVLVPSVSVLVLVARFFGGFVYFTRGRFFNFNIFLKQLLR